MAKEHFANFQDTFFAVPTRKGGNVTRNKFYADRKILAVCEHKLDELGFRSFSFLGQGAFALAFQTTRNQVVRIAVGESFYSGVRIKHPAVLQAIESFDIPNPASPDDTLHIDVLPKVITDPKRVTRKHMQQVHDALMESGYYAYDLFRPGNVGIIEVDGKQIPVLIDVGVLKTRNDGYRAANDNHLAPWLDADGSWLQSKFESRTKSSGIIPREQADSIAELMQHGERVSETVKAINEDGLSVDELAEIYSRAANKVTADNGQISFSERIAEERALLTGKQRDDFGWEPKQKAALDQSLRGPRKLKERLLGAVGIKRDSRPKNEIMSAITDDKLYPHQIAYIQEQAGKRMAENPSGRSYSEIIREERQKLIKELRSDEPNR